MNAARATILTAVLFLSAVAQPAADLILINGNIRTFDEKNPRAEALAVADGRIVAVGKTRDIRKLAGANTRVINAGGRLVVPGFNDAHVHFTAIGNRFSHLDLGGVSFTAIREKVAEYSTVLPKGRWILGSGLASDGRVDSEVPTRWMLDEVTPDHPVLLYFASSGVAVANTRAIGLAGIAPKTIDPPGGRVFKRVDGEPTGVLTGTAIALVRRHVPSDHERNWAELAETASNYAASLGVTSVQDVHSDSHYETFEKLAAVGRLKTRIYECVGIGDRAKAADAGFRAASGNGMVRTGCVKGMAAGVSEEVAELRRTVAEADKAGLHVMIHAIGGAANANALDAFEAATTLNGPRDRRFRVEHASRLRSTDMPRFARVGIIASMQPHLFYSEGFAGDNYRTLLASRVVLAFGSDASITDFNPLFGIYAAVNSAGSTSISVEDAVKAYTLGSAYAEFQEKEKGKLEKGKLADFVVLSDDIFAMDRRQIRAVTVLLTVVGGRVVFDRLNASKTDRL